MTWKPSGPQQAYVDRILEMPRSFAHAILRFAREADVAGEADQYGYHLVYIGRELWFEMLVIRTWIGTLFACLLVCVASCRFVGGLTLLYSLATVSQPGVILRNGRSNQARVASGMG